ncbi:hypothetical protein RHGRI_038731 [Rhododendron griersonianum]|uniref:PB1 domain-containing protein n=1 Tax=Rhododendron griersonianum TaxID=479676 RepID=A0AAV6HIJ4_9ERIC|nr:hypothetical protein RHGRI_038731 [Rhododendron griersonianum]
MEYFLMAKVWRPPDQHGKGNTSTAREIPSHNVQTGMEGEPVGQNQEENECRRDFMGRQIALDTESGLITVSRPPDQHGERNTSTARETPSHNVQTGIEGVPVGQNQEANEFRPDFTEGSIPSNTENGLIKGSYFGFPPPQITSMPSEYMGGSIDLRNSLANLTFATCSDQAAPSQHVQGQSMHPTVYPDHNVFPQTQIVSSQEPFSEPLGFPPPQITLMPSENKGGSIDLRNSLASQVVSDGHISGSTNSTFATCSDQAALSQHLQGQSMHPTVYPDHNVFPQTQIVSSQEPFSDALGFPPPQITSMPNENMGGSIDLRNSLANLTFATCSDQAAPSQHVQGQSMHPTVYPDHNVFPQTHIVSSKEPFSEGRVMIKAFCRDADNTIIKFWFHLTSGIVDLKKEVSKRLNVEVDRFVVKYKDKYEDLISILCDDDLKLYLSSSLGNDEINVLVHDKVGGTPNFCEKCRSPMQTRA